MSQKYDKDFKIQTARMIQEQGKPVAQVVRELGVSDNTCTVGSANSNRIRSTLFAAAAI